jgi:hypothetical protein
MKIAFPPALLAAFCMTNGAAPAVAGEDGHSELNALPQQVHELFLTESVFPNERGEYQPFVAAEYQRHLDDSWHTLFDLGLEYGITDRLQVSASVPWVAIHDDGDSRSGAGDFSAELLYNVVPATAPVALSLAAGVTLPTGNEDRGFGEGEKVLELTMIMAGRAADVQWQLNLGGEWTQDEAELVYSLAVLPMQRPSTIVPTLELSGAESEDGRKLYGTPGLHWRPAEDHGLGLGVPVGLTHGTQHIGVMMYYTVEF